MVSSDNNTPPDSEGTRFSDTIDEEDIDRIKRNTEDEDLSFAPFMGQTYRQLILTYIMGISLQIVVYFSLPFIFNIEGSFLFEPGGEGLRIRRRVGAVASFVAGIYFVISTTRARGTPGFNLIYGFAPPIIFGVIHILLMESGEPPFAVPGSPLGILEPSRVVTFLYMSLPHVVLLIILKYVIEIWVRIDEDNLRKAIEWEKKHLAYPYFSDREVSERISQGTNGDKNDTT